MTDSSASGEESPPNEEVDCPTNDKPEPTEESEPLRPQPNAEGEEHPQEAKAKAKQGWGGARKGAGRKKAPSRKGLKLKMASPFPGVFWVSCLGREGFVSVVSVSWRNCLVELCLKDAEE